MKIRPFVQLLAIAGSALAFLPLEAQAASCSVNQVTINKIEVTPLDGQGIVYQAPPPLTGLDRKSERQMTRGKVEIESRIDLHGTGVERARERLHSFIVSQRSNGQRMVLVITGKGESPFARHTLHGSGHYHAPERQGVLRRKVPEWLHEAEFRAHVAGFQPAHPRHGGGGAYYVKLRRKERGGL